MNRPAAKPQLSPAAASSGDRLSDAWHRLRAFDDGAIMRAVFYVLLAAVVVALASDYRQLREESARQAQRPEMANPILPPFVPGEETAAPSHRPDVTADPARLRQTMTMTLAAGGTLLLEGTIDVGAAPRFAAEMDRIGEYVERIDLNSPGGSVLDALAIAREIRERELTTRVEAGSLCASSCPLILAGGAERIVVEGAAVGVHQIFSPGRQGLSVDAEISGTQTVTAKITRHLEAMDVDPALWLHALETPPRQLYYLTVGELTDYRLATEIVPAD